MSILHTVHLLDSCLALYCRLHGTYYMLPRKYYIFIYDTSHTTQYILRITYHTSLCVLHIAYTCWVRVWFCIADYIVYIICRLLHIAYYTPQTTQYISHIIYRISHFTYHTSHCVLHIAYTCWIRVRLCVGSAEEFSKVSAIVNFHSKFKRKLTFEKFWFNLTLWECVSYCILHLRLILHIAQTSDLPRPI